MLMDEFTDFIVLKLANFVTSSYMTIRDTVDDLKLDTLLITSSERHH